MGPECPVITLPCTANSSSPVTLSPNSWSHLPATTLGHASWSCSSHTVAAGWIASAIMHTATACRSSEHSHLSQTSWSSLPNHTPSHTEAAGWIAFAHRNGVCILGTLNTGHHFPLHLSITLPGQINPNHTQAGLRLRTATACASLERSSPSGARGAGPVSSYLARSRLRGVPPTASWPWRYITALRGG